MVISAAWLWYVGAGVLLLVGAWCLHTGVLRGRSRGRLRCPRCWYDMEGAAGLAGADCPPGTLVCPECGHDAGSVRRLRRGRRRWGLLSLGVLALLGSGASVLAPGALRDGWRSVAPTWVVLMQAPPRDKPVALQAPAPNARVAPFVPRYDAWAGELVRRAGAGRLSQAGWERLLFQDGLPRGTWVAGVAYRVPLRTPSWSGATIGLDMVPSRVLVDGADRSFEFVGVGAQRVGIGTGPWEQTIELGALSTGRHRVAIEFDATPGGFMGVAAGITAPAPFKVTYEFPLRVLESPDEAFEAVGDEANATIDRFAWTNHATDLDGSVGWFATIPSDGNRASYRMMLRDREADEAGLTVEREDALAGVCMAADAELIIDGVAVQRVACDAKFDPATGVSLEARFGGTLALADMSPEQREGVRVRLRGIFPASLSERPDCGAYWVGTVDLPLSRVRMPISDEIEARRAGRSRDGGAER